MVRPPGFEQPYHTLKRLLHQQAQLLHEQPFPPVPRPGGVPRRGGGATGEDAAGLTGAGAEADAGGPDGNVAASVLSAKTEDNAGAQEKSSEDPADQSPGSEDPQRVAGHPRSNSAFIIAPAIGIPDTHQGTEKRHCPITKAGSPGTCPAPPTRRVPSPGKSGGSRSTRTRGRRKPRTCGGSRSHSAGRGQVPLRGAARARHSR